MGLTTPARNAALSLPSIEAAIRAIRQDYPALQRTGFTNLVTNGGFDTGTTGWSAGADGILSYDAGNTRALLTNGSASNNGIVFQNVTLLAGARFRLAGDITDGTATLPRLGAGTSGTGATSLHIYGIGQNVSTSSNVVVPFTPTQAASAVGMALNSITNGHTAFLDNVSLWEADPADDAPWLRLPYGHRVMQGDQMHPLASIQRDADMLHSVDFTEIWRNGQAFIKPVNAPGVSTRFSIVSYKAI